MNASLARAFLTAMDKPIAPEDHGWPDADRRARALVLELLAARDAGASLCPSEAARALARGPDGPAATWRAAMPAVHGAVDALLAEGRVRLAWRGRPLPARAGPYRIHAVDD